MFIAAIILALLFTGFYSGTEIAFISANKLLIELKRKRDGNGVTLSKFFDKPAQFIGTMLVGHNIALVVLTFLLTAAIEGYVKTHITNDELWASLIITVFITLIVLIFAEYLPKTIFRLYADRILFGMAGFIRLNQLILTAPTWLMTRISGFLLKVFFNTKEEIDEETLTRVDLEHFVKNAFQKSQKNDESVDTELFNKALQLRNVKVKQCMIPRSEIGQIDVSESVADLRQHFKDTNFSRIIVTQNNDLDDILGYVHHQKALHLPKDIKGQIMEIECVPEVMKVFDLMNKFIKEQNSIACVVDEFGSTSGLITLEDILEQIFGDIADEHDHEDLIEQVISENEFIFSGRLEINYLNETYHLQIPVAEKGDYHTLSGYLVTTLADIPEESEAIHLENDPYTYIPELVSETKIETVRIIC